MSNLPGHVTSILENGMQFPLEQVDRLCMLTANELKQVLVDYNSTTGNISLPDDQISTNLFAIFHKNVSKHGHKLALVQESEHGLLQLSYLELYKHVTNVGKQLQKHLQEKIEFALNTAPNDSNLNEACLKGNAVQNFEPQYVALFLPRGLSFVLSSLAVLMMNKTVAVLHSSYAKEQVMSCLSTLGNPILITTVEKQEEIGLKYHSIFLVESVLPNSCMATEANDVPNCVGGNETPYCCFTSGSTGEPKAVLVKTKTILNRTLFNINLCQIDSTSRAMFITPPGFLPSLIDIWVTFVVGGSLHIPLESTRLDLEKLKQWIYKQEITSFFVSTTVLCELLRGNSDNDRLLLSKLKWIAAAGERLQSLNLLNYTFNCLHCYGSTETFDICAKVLKCGENYEFPPFGPPISNVFVYVLDANRQPVPVGINGDIYVSGVGLMAGYVGITKQALIHNPFNPGTNMYATGDVGFWNKGDLTVVGRKDSQVKIHGMRLELGEVEAVIEKYPGIKQVIVTMRQINNVKQLIAICTVQDPNNFPSSQNVKTFLSTRLQRHAIPAEIHFVPGFTRTPSGKINRKSTEYRFLKSAPSKYSEIFKDIRQRWASVIGIPEDLVLPTSDFFSLGGNSIHAFRFTQSLQDKFPTVKPTHLFQFTMLSDFVNFLEGNSLDKHDVNFEKELNLNLTFDPAIIGKPPKIIERSLLTGSTGYLGISLLLELLTLTSQEVTCLVRAKTNEEAQRKLYLSIKRHGLTSLFEKFSKSRYIVLAGDLSLPKFGLTESTFKSLSLTINVIYHAAAEVNHMKSYAQLKNTTVAMTKEVIKFAVTGKLKWIHHMSSVVVFDGVIIPDFADVFYAKEEDVPEHIDPRNMRSGYAQSKWVCEKLLSRAIENGVPGAIYRLGEVGSHLTLNLVNANDALFGFLVACKKLRQFPNTLCTIPYVGLDFATKAVVNESEAMLHQPIPGKVYFHVIQSEFSLQHFAQVETKQCEFVDLDSWEQKFNSECQSDRFAINALVFINTLKHGNAGSESGRGSVTRNIQFEFANKASRTENEKREIAAICVKRFVGMADMKFF